MRFKIKIRISGTLVPLTIQDKDSAIVRRRRRQVISIVLRRGKKVIKIRVDAAKRSSRFTIGVTVWIQDGTI